MSIMRKKMEVSKLSAKVFFKENYSFNTKKETGLINKISKILRYLNHINYQSIINYLS